MTTKQANGKDQVAAMAQLWQPSELAGFRIGDLCDLPSIGRCEVLALMPPSLLRLRTSTGAELNAGWRACIKVSQRGKS